MKGNEGEESDSRQLEGWREKGGRESFDLVISKLKNL